MIMPNITGHIALPGPLEYKDRLSLRNPRDALHHGERAANK